MAHHKDKKPKRARSGCLMCKPHKGRNGKDCHRHGVKRRPLPQES